LQTGELSARYLYDVRSLGGFAVLSDSQGTMHCSSGFVLESEQDELHLGPVLENEGGQICWDRTFEVIKVHGRAFPAVISRDVYFRSLAYNIALLPIDGNAMNIDHPLCTVSVNYSPTFEIAEWFRAPELSDTTDQELRSKLEPILTTLAAGQYQQPPSGDEGTLTDQFLQEYDRHGSAVSHIVPFARMPANPYSQLAGPLSPITLGGKNYMLGFGDAQFGWRTWIDFAFGLWVTDGAELRPIVGGFMGKRGAHLEISVESGQR